MQPIPYLFFKGTCGEAMRFYARAFGSPAPEIVPFSAMPEEARASMPSGTPADAVMHAALKVGEGWLYGSDDLSGDTPRMAGVSINLTLPDEAETKRVYAALAEGGEMRMPLAPMFWTSAFGTLTDRYGIRWMLMAEGTGA